MPSVSVTNLTVGGLVKIQDDLIKGSIQLFGYHGNLQHEGTGTDPITFMTVVLPEGFSEGYIGEIDITYMGNIYNNFMYSFEGPDDIENSFIERRGIVSYLPYTNEYFSAKYIVFCEDNFSTPTVHTIDTVYADRLVGMHLVPDYTYSQAIECSDVSVRTMTFKYQPPNDITMQDYADIDPVFFYEIKSGSGFPKSYLNGITIYEG